MRALLLNSGGPDSRLLGAMLACQGWELHSLYVAHGTPHVERAQVAAQRTARLFGAPHDIARVIWPAPVVGRYTASETFWSVPFTIQTVLLHGAVLARALDVEYVAIATKADVWAERMVELGQELLGLCRTARPVTLLHPFSELHTYQQVLDKLGGDPPPLDDTVSCAHAEPCGICHKCVERRALGIRLG